MVFFVVAASLPQNSEQANDDLLRSCTSVNGRQAASVYPVKVDKAKFKIGTLDMLMELNETLVKVDQNLEGTVKRMEKIVFEIETLYKNAKENNLIIKPFVEIPNKGERQQVDF